MKKKSKYISFFEIVNSTLLINSKFYTTEKYIYAWDGVPLKKLHLRFLSNFYYSKK